jgi:hypothetical protein
VSAWWDASMTDQGPRGGMLLNCTRGRRVLGEQDIASEVFFYRLQFPFTKNCAAARY